MHTGHESGASQTDAAMLIRVSGSESESESMRCPVYLAVTTSS